MDVPFTHHCGDENARERNHGAHRQINSAREDHERCPDRRDAQKGVVAKKIHRHAQRKEFRERQPACDVKRQQDKRGRQERNIFGGQARFHFGSGERPGPPGGVFCSIQCKPPGGPRAPPGLSGGKVHFFFTIKEIFRRNAGDCTRQTVRMASAFGTGAISALTFRMYIVVVNVWMNKPPTSAPARKKRPPVRDVPPTTTARMASSSRNNPAWLASAHLMFEAETNPASPAQSPEKT